MASNQKETMPEDVLNEAAIAVSSLLPEKSKSVYEKEYKTFCDWKTIKTVKTVNEEILLPYFLEKSQEVKVSTLWSHYLMLKATLSINENIDISKFSRLIAFIKRQSSGYKPKKSRTFEKPYFYTFLSEAPNEMYLCMKVVLIMGIAGGCRIDELHKIRVDLIEIYKKYKNLRPQNVPHRKFFLCYRNQKRTIQPIGINTFAKIPQMIAKYLKLPNHDLYTGHCFRRTSANLLANAGADLLTLKRHGDWKSSTVAEQYIDESIAQKISTSRKILTDVNSNERLGTSTALGPD